MRNCIYPAQRRVFCFVGGGNDNHVNYANKGGRKLCKWCFDSHNWRLISERHSRDSWYRVHDRYIRGELVLQTTGE